MAKTLKQAYNDAVTAAVELLQRTPGPVAISRDPSVECWVKKIEGRAFYHQVAAIVGAEPSDDLTIMVVNNALENSEKTRDRVRSADGNGFVLTYTKRQPS